MQERKITWTTEKNIENISKHHISLEVAQYVFQDQERIERLDQSEGNASGEERWQTIGKVGRLLFVVYMERGNETRIISARKAEKPERRSYNGYYHVDGKGWTKAT
ncbi:MAG: BrnT family toxin [Treponemataceae bacterium]|nr:MAG: BrnT family toxin [Treponemataceae bacterium]